MERRHRDAQSLLIRVKDYRPRVGQNLRGWKGEVSGGWVCGLREYAKETLSFICRVIHGFGFAET